jgi:hypothetical protein
MIHAEVPGRPKMSAYQQCKQIGKQKVKPFKAKTQFGVRFGNVYP